VKKARVRLTDDALRDAKAALAWWHDNRPEAPGLVREEFAALLDLLRTAPKIGTPYIHRRIKGVRRAVLQRSRYHVYYVHDASNDDVVVLAISSTLRGKPPKLRMG
jgi:plasmid stabilization system protein ParE